jgi:hypothetical protein
MTVVLYAAAAYNIVWGTIAVLFPLALFRWAGVEPPRHPALWQCLGTLVGAFGVGYLAAARDPITHWPIVLVGLIGKVVAPIWFLVAVARGEVRWALGATIPTDDIIWWVPFGLILLHAYRRHAVHLRLAREPRSLRRA